MDISQLVKLSKQKDKQSQEILLGYYEPFLKNVTSNVSKRLFNTNDIQDIYQEARVLFLEFIDKYDENISNFGYFLKKNFYFNLLQKCRNYKYNPNITSTELIDIEDTKDIFSRINTINDVTNAIHLLPIKQQIAIKLYYFIELPQEQCSILMDINQSSFSKLLERARKNLKKNLKSNICVK